DHEVLAAAEVNRRFPGYRLPDGHRALFQPEGGFIASERAITAHVTLAQADGAETHARERVLAWRRTGEGVEVETERGRYRAEGWGRAAGGWIGERAPALGGLAVPGRQVLGWFQPSRPEAFRPDRFPVLNAAFDEGRYYALPVWGVPGFKIGLYHHLG